MHRECSQHEPATEFLRIHGAIRFGGDAFASTPGVQKSGPAQRLGTESSQLGVPAMSKYIPFYTHPLCGVDFRREFGFSPSRTHPDKVADFIADSLVDAALAQSRDASTRIQVVVIGDDVFVHGEASTGSRESRERVVRAALVTTFGEARAATFHVADHVRPLRVPSKRGARAVGALTGPQFVVGHACADTPAHLGHATVAAHALMQRFDDAPVSSVAPHDIRSVRIAYQEDRMNRVPVSLRLVHAPGADVGEPFVAHLRRELLPEILGAEWTPAVAEAFSLSVVAGPDERGVVGRSGRCALTDTYGAHVVAPSAPMVGRDPWRAERAGAHFARHVAREAVRQNLAKAATIKAVYEAGRDEPLHVSIQVPRYIENDWTSSFIKGFDFRIPAIVEQLDLTRPVHAEGANHGRFGSTRRIG